MTFTAEIDWQTISTEDGDVLVRLTGSQPESWWTLFMSTAEIWESETRGQTWRAISLQADETIRFEEIADDYEEDGLRAYLSDLVDLVNTQHARG